MIRRAPIAERSFPQWSMGFKLIEPHEITRHPAYAPAFKYGYDVSILGARPGIALEILQQFSSRAHP